MAFLPDGGRWLTERSNTVRSEHVRIGRYGDLPRWYPRKSTEPPNHPIYYIPPCFGQLRTRKVPKSFLAARMGDEDGEGEQ